MESPVSDGTIEENFEEELVNAPQVVEGITSLNNKETGNLSDDLDEYDVRKVNNKYCRYFVRIKNEFLKILTDFIMVIHIVQQDSFHNKEVVNYNYIYKNMHTWLITAFYLILLSLVIIISFRLKKTKTLVMLPSMVWLM